ncbi:MAG: serine/threonine protein kinase [Myxococcales bacterium]|nr:serine/threonine protein kinase [Myxococcales bacterium]
MDETQQGETLDGTALPSGDARAPARASPDPLSASRIGRYAILRRLGAGGMGVVFAAYDEQLDRKVAIKLLHRREGDSRLLREAQGLARLSHPNVVQIYEIGEHEGAVFMAMEFIAGRTLGSWLKEAPRRRAEILEAFTAAGRGLVAAHAARLIHRDFKPDNVMIGDDGRIKVMDFGLVRAEGEAAPDDEDRTIPPAPSVPEEVSLERSLGRSGLGEALTRTGSVMGTPAYMAPEQHCGQGTDGRSDQFGFCVALWEALYGQRPFAGDTVASLTYAVLRGERQEPPRDADVPGWLRRVLERGLSIDPEARWPSMEALLDALARDPSRRRPLWLGALAAGLVVAGAWGWAELREREAEREAERARASAIEACEHEGHDRVAEAWNEERAERARRAFEASALSFAADAWARSAASLDAYATELGDALSGTCIAAEVEGTLEPAEAELARRCLDDRLAQLDALGSLLSEADDGRIHRVMSSVTDLPLVGQCDDPRSLARQAPLPDDPEIRERVWALRAELTELRVRQTMGELDDALERAEALVVRAQELGWPPMVAAATFVRADLRDDLGDYPRARADFEEAAFVAAKAGDDVLALDVVIDLVHNVGVDFDDPEGGLRLARLAQVLVVRTHAEGSLVEARLLTNTGSIHQRRGDVALALADFEAALVLQEALLPPRHPTLSIALNNIGASHGQAGDLERALGYFERSLAIREASYPAGHPRLATAFLNYGMTLSRLERYDEARVALERALEIYRESLPADHPDIAMALVGLANVDFGVGDFASAVERYEEVVGIREAKLPADHVEIGQARMDMGRSLVANHEYERGEEQLRRAIAIYLASGSEGRERLVRGWRELAYAQRQHGDGAGALASLEEALRIAAEPGLDPLVGAAVRWDLARSLWQLAPQRREEAIEVMKACYLDYAEHGELGELDEIVEWLHERGAEPPSWPSAPPAPPAGPGSPGPTPPA